MRVRMGFILLFVLSFNSHAQTHKKSFAQRFNLIKNEDHYIPNPRFKNILSRKDGDGELAKIVIINDERLKKLELFLFFIQIEGSCHACSGELWLYSENKRPSVVQLMKSAGNFGNPPRLIDIFSRKRQYYLLFKHVFEGQGVTESSLELVSYSKEKPESKSVYWSFLSDVSFSGATNNCRGWSTKYKVDYERGRIDFLKSGHDCNLDNGGIVDRSRNSRKVYKKDFYVFE